MPWTEKQEQVITERDKTILVSAAAGSGNARGTYLPEDD